MTHPTGSVQESRWVGGSYRGGNGAFFMQGVGGVGCALPGAVVLVI